MNNVKNNSKVKNLDMFINFILPYQVNPNKTSLKKNNNKNNNNLNNQNNKNNNNNNNINN